MKRTVLCMLFLLTASLLQAQFIELREARVDFFPGLKESSDNSFSYLVKEDHSGAFAKDALGFMRTNFDVQAFFKAIDWDPKEECTVSFKNSKGELLANFSGKGELLGTRQNFKNVLVPAEVRDELYRNHKGWAMVGNRYSASSRGEILDREVYRVKLKKDNKKQVVKIHPQRLRGSKVASK